MQLCIEVHVLKRLLVEIRYHVVIVSIFLTEVAVLELDYGDVDVDLLVHYYLVTDIRFFVLLVLTAGSAHYSFLLKSNTVGIVKDVKT